MSNRSLWPPRHRAVDIVGTKIDTYLESLRTRLDAQPKAGRRPDRQSPRAASSKVLVDWFWRWLRSWLWALGDAFPPYRKVEGLLESKEPTPEGRFHIRVAGARVQVDRPTFDSLSVGDMLRVRYTRGNRAVNIDRVVFENGHQ